VFETSPLSVWFYHALSAEGLPAICIDARHAKAALDMAANKTDANAIEDPANFRTSRSVGAWLGLTTRRYQSGEVDYDGHISRRGDAHLRSLLYEAATVILTRAHARGDLRTWGLKLREKIGFKRAAVAVARKLAVIMHAMLKSGEDFERAAGI
jgi:transposase